MHRTQRQVWLNRVALVVVSAATLSFSGCAKLYHLSHYNFFGLEWADHHRTYYQSPYTGRIIAKEHGHFCVAEPPCFGFEPTCWTPWPAQCPQQCNQPLLSDMPTIIEEVGPSTPSVISPEPMPPQSDAASPADAAAGEEGDAAVDIEPGTPPDETDESGWREATPSEESPEPEDSTRTLPLQKQPLTGQPSSDSMFPLPDEYKPVIAWDTSVPRREIDQQLVFVEEPASLPNRPVESDADDVSPIVLTEESDSTPTQQSPAVPATPDIDPPRPERLALRVDATDPAPAAVTAPQETQIEAADAATDADAAGTPVETIAPVGPAAPVTETTSVPTVPSFKITAVPPPVRVSRNTTPVPEPHAARGATIRFASEASSSLRVGDASHHSGNDTSLRFR